LDKIALLLADDEGSEDRSNDDDASVVAAPSIAQGVRDFCQHVVALLFW
jgi:hypothetical protein